MPYPGLFELVLTTQSVMDRIVNYRGLENIVFLAIDMDHPTLGVAAQERFEVTNVPFLIILGGVGNHGTLGEYRALPNSVRAVRNALTSSCRLQLEEQ